MKIHPLTIGWFALALGLPGSLPAQEPARSAGTAAAVDRFSWLENVESARAMTWVKNHNDATMRTLGSDPRFVPLRDRIRAILDFRDRIPAPDIEGNRIDNFWQDASHPRGIWRSSSWNSYVGGSPDWRTVIDVDSLARAEKVAWSWSGATCLPPAHRECLVFLSRGGADAVEIREFNVESGQFIKGGFFLPEAKQNVAWIGPDAILVSTDFGSGTLTTSGYPRIAKLWHRATPLASAITLFQGDSTDVSVGVGAVEVGETIIGTVGHAPTFFESTTYILRDDSLVKLVLPLDADPAFLGDQLVVYLRSPWTVDRDSFPGGAIVATTLADFLAGQGKFSLLIAPGSRQTIDGMRTTKDYLLVHLLDNVRSKLLRFQRGRAGWMTDTVAVPDLGSVTGIATSAATNRFFFNFSGFTQPTTQYLADEDGSIRSLKSLPAQFDAKGLMTEQFEATSKDGTLIPYFIVHRDSLRLNGSNPTLLYGYGGFEISLPPGYNPITGASWLEKGGVYVVANIRGGGEFGPTWHRAAMKEHRQRAYDDFIAVAEDIIARRVTTPAHLGIMGGSNGGLLMGVMLTQRPELWNAVAILNPLLDMRRYNHLLAGASWMGEYQNLRPGASYPRPFIGTTTRDDRVHPAHARKFAAKLEGLGQRVYFFENTEGGHGAGVTSEQQAQERALMFTYFWRQLGSSPGPLTP